MKFSAYGRAYHLRIATAEDLQNAAALDEAHWVATSAPIDTLSCDPTLLRLLDADGNGRIACHELKDAICWLLAVLGDHSGVTAGSKVLPLEAVDADTPQGSEVLQAAGKILTKIGRPDAGAITLEQIHQVKAQVEATPVSEAGVALPEAAEDAEIRQFIADVVMTVGGAEHPSGSQGLTSAKLDEFLAAAADHLAWREKGLIPSGQDGTEIMPLGAKTGETYALFSSVRTKIDQYFAQCEAAALDEKLVLRMGWTEDELGGLDFDDPAVIEDVLKKAPLAKASPSRALRFDDQTNPYYAEQLEAFRREVAAPVLGEPPAALSAGHWQRIKSYFAAHQAWLEAKPGEAVEKLGPAKLQKYLAGRFAAAARSLISESAKTAVDLDNVRLIERLILYQAYMKDLANNFVSFPDLYDVERRAMFEMGTLVMDGRRFNLAVRVRGRAEHARVAKTSNMHVLYVVASPKQGGDGFEIAVPVTSGGRGNLCEGKRGVFYDVSGREYDAVVAAIIENPIGFKEALVSPFRRLGRLVSGKIEAITAKAEQRLDTSATTAVSQVSETSAQPQPQARTGMSGGMLLGAGVALAAVGSALAYITKTLADTRWWAILIGLGVAVLLVILPTVVIALLKLRKRDLSAILEGSGWAVNARMRLTFKQSRFFTARPRYPKGSKGARRYLWRTLLIAALIVGMIAAGAYVLRRYTGPAQSPAEKAPPAKADEKK
jgi:F0F1-type ATP synthase assembly protein I